MGKGSYNGLPMGAVSQACAVRPWYAFHLTLCALEQPRGERLESAHGESVDRRVLPPQE